MARKYRRDNRGRFASRGSGATARGGRLKTAGGKKRETQTMQASAAPKGTIGKPRGLKPGAIKPAAKAGAASQKSGTVALSQVKRYNALDRARTKEKKTYSRELSRVTGSTDRRRASAAMPKADLASRKISRIESTMRKLSNSPSSPNVPVLPKAKKVGERITGRRNLYRRVTPTTQAPRVANTVSRSRPTPKPARRKPLTGVNSVVGRNVAGFKGLPVSLRSRKQATSAQAARRRSLLSRNAVSTGGTFKRGVNRQPNLLTGRVDRVGAGKFRPVSKRRR